MYGRTIPFVLVILSLQVIDIFGIPPKEDTRRCPRGTPVSRDCNPRTFPSTCPSGYRCYSPTDGSGLCCPDSAKVTCPSGGNPAGPCNPFGVIQCPSGHFCSSVSVDGSGTCCPLDMPMLSVRCRNGGTPNGRCVPSVTNQCVGGFFCQDVPGDRTGVCCPTRIVQPPLDTRRCPRGTPVSRDCNPRTFPSTCPSGYHCYSPMDGSGLCCPDSAKVTCPSGGNPAGPCNSFGVNQCPSGYFCSSVSVDGSGTCCPLDMPMLPVRCRNGGTPNGRCVPSVTNQCAGGFFCQNVPGDRTGICCPTRIVQPSLGSCPVVNNVGPCVILPGHCLSDDECRQGQRCCPDRCGNVCKYVGGDSYIPRSDLKG